MGAKWANAAAGSVVSNGVTAFFLSWLGMGLGCFLDDESVDRVIGATL
jgi:hypothetical protein